uniref:Uncharacterized protein n=1 Tax=Sphaerodactylus townsendi TaxID=933632 RepID=A0ACB8FQP7_9SAUR
MISWLEGIGAEELEEKIWKLQESSSEAMEKLTVLEAEVQLIGQELRVEKLLWNTCYLDLLREHKIYLCSRSEGHGET